MSAAVTDPNDLSLIELFLMEMSSHCATLLNETAVAETDGGEPDFQAMHRAVHSIKGAARIVDLKAIVALTTAMERVVTDGAAPLRSNASLRTAFIACVEHLQDLARLPADEVRDHIGLHKNLLTHLRANLESCAGAGGTPPPPQTPPSRPVAATRGTDRALFDLFREDADKHITVLADNIIRLEQTPQDPALLESSMRAVHSLKGAARVIELLEVVELAHRMEDLFVAAQEGRLTINSSHIDSLLAAVDLFRELCALEAAALAPWFTANEERIRDLEKAFSRPGEHASAPPAGDDATQARRPTRGKLEQPEGETATTLKVSSAAMSKLMGLAGEAMIEARWLPTLVSKTFLLKKYQDDIWRTIDKIRRLAAESIGPSVDSRFRSLSAKVATCNEYLNEYLSELDDHARTAGDIAHRLQREVIFNRMQPFADGLKPLPRLIRDLARSQNKSVKMEVKGADTLVDRDILERLDAPLTHLVTNAIDHGIESPEERRRQGKDEQAAIIIEAGHEAGMLHITVADDGRGIDVDQLRHTVIERRLVSEKIARELDEDELLEFIFLPNFSTRSEVSKTSGRGVGLDVVYNTVREIRGNIAVSSVYGKGTYFELRLPLTLSIIRGLNVMINNEPYSFPLVNIEHVTRVAASEIKEIEGRQYIVIGNKRAGIVSARQVLDLPEAPMGEEELPIVIMGDGQKSYGMIVDSFIGIRDLVVHPLTPRLGKLRSISAAAIAENGTPILILDVQDLLLTMNHLISGNRLQRIDTEARPAPSGRPRVLVVDDSITVREVERKLLDERGYEVETAADGLEAWSLIRRLDFDLVITDVDMPNMDGIELVVQIKDSPEYEHIPVIIVSYKDRDEDKNRGLEAGADYYLTKGSFDDRTLFDAVEDLIGPALPDEAAP